MKNKILPILLITLTIVYSFAIPVLADQEDVVSLGADPSLNSRKRSLNILMSSVMKSD